MIDSHAHVSFDAYDEDRDEVIARAYEHGLSGWIEIGTDVVQSERAISLAARYEGVYATAGVHPSDIGDMDERSWDRIETMLEDPVVCAVGEVGFDLYRGGDAQAQRRAVERFISLAQRYVKPVVFHVRDGEHESAHEHMIDVLRACGDRERPSGVMHTFSGTQEQADAYLELGMHLSFSGVVTFKNAGVTADVARRVPLERLLIETDAPFLCPEPYRGKRNEPSYVRFVAEKVADLRGDPIDTVRRVTAENTERLFRM